MKSNRRAVLITGLGVISPLGNSSAEVIQALENCRSGIALLHADPLDKDFPAGRVPASFQHLFSRLERPYLDRCQQMAVLAAQQALEDAGLDSLAAEGERAGIYYGNVHGGVATEQACFRDFFLEHRQSAPPYSAMAIMHNSGAAQISIRHQIFGPVHTYGSACSSSACAIGEAAKAIRDGHLDVAVAGGAEAPLVSGLISVFDGTGALADPDGDDVARSCKPFSRQRRGLVLGEGAAFFVLEEEGRARRRGAHGHGYLSGYGLASDAHHIGIPKAEGQIRALRAALADAALEPGAIGYLNAHATATRTGDMVEAYAIRSVFGATPAAVQVSSTKALHGHLLGAAGALEFMIAVLAMRESLLPATAYLEEVDPACELNHVLGTRAKESQIERAMSFSCGFGGTNAALIASRRRERE